MDQINCYQNVTTKLIVRTKIGIFAYYQSIIIQLLCANIGYVSLIFIIRGGP